jgi:hypothetical protein
MVAAVATLRLEALETWILSMTNGIVEAAKYHLR